MSQQRKIAARKVEGLKEIKEYLDGQGNFVLTTFSGLTVGQITELRAEMRQKNSRLKVVKNNLFEIALRESGKHSAVAEKFQKDLKGPVAVIFAGGEFPSVSKALVDYSKKNDKVQIKSGCMDGSFLSKGEVVQIAELPSREDLLAIIARGLNTPAQKIAYGVNEVMSSLARAIKAVGEKNG